MQRVWPLAFPLPGLRRPLAFPIATGAGFPIVPLTRGNAELAHDYYIGRFAFGKAEAVAGVDGIMAVAPPDEAWARAFHSFSWLANIEANGLELHRIFARRLIAQWIEHKRRLPRQACEILVASRRLMSFTVHAPFLLRGASPEFSAHFCKMLTTEMAKLAAAAPRLRREDERMTAAIAVAYAVSGWRGLDGLAARAFARLDAELAAQILPDGGHVSRKPAVLLDLLHDLLPLKHALDASRRQVSPGLAAALERMVPMLRLLCHFDGGLAVFRGVDDLATMRVRAVFEQDQVGGRPLSLAPQSGYARLTQGDATLIADVGPAGRLAFEFSEGLSRVVVNCGVAIAAGHSTVEFDAAEQQARRISHWFAPRKPTGPQAEVRVTAEGSLLQAIDHDAAPALSHERRLYLAAEGHDLRGEDRFSANGSSSTPFVIRFHLHPAVKATLSKDGASISLATPSRTGWRFSARGGQIGLDHSVFFPGSPRRAQQIVVTGETGSTEKVNWAFKRIEKREVQKKRETEVPSLPF